MNKFRLKANFLAITAAHLGTILSYNSKNTNIQINLMEKLLQRQDLISQFISTFTQSLMKDMTRAEEKKKLLFLCIYLSFETCA